MEPDTISLEATPSSSVEIRHLLYSLVIPRPIAWISTVSGDGVENIAPHSFFNVVSGIPPIVMFASSQPHEQTQDGMKDTLRNVLDNGEFVINFVPRAFASSMNVTSTIASPEVDEFELAGLSKCRSRSVRPSRVKGAPAAMECKLHSHAQIGDATVVYGTVTFVHVSNAVMKDGRPDPAKLDPIARLGGSLYSSLGDVFPMKRP